MLTVHHLEDSRSQRILWLLEELGVDYGIEKSVRNPETMLGPEDQQDVHPLGKWPVIDHDGMVLAESGAIVEYLISEFGAGRMRPSRESMAYTDYLFWTHFPEASMQPNLVMSLVLSEGAKRAPIILRPIIRSFADRVIDTFAMPRLKSQMAVIDDTLKHRNWFAGNDISGADIMMSFALETAMFRVPQARETFPHIMDYVVRNQSRPAYRSALGKGGRYKYLLKA